MSFKRPPPICTLCSLQISVHHIINVLNVRSYIGSLVRTPPTLCEDCTYEQYTERKRKVQ